jgi:peptidoglycan/LPS O-acetylase OafA/YrhL
MEDEPNPEKKKSTLGRIFLSFSILLNVKKLFNTSNPQNKTMTSLNGIRTLSIFWVVLGHTFGMLLYIPLTNLMTVNKISKTIFFPIISGAYFSVDIFFFFSAFLGFYLITEKLKETKKGWKAYFFLYVHRYIRILPALMLMLGLAIYVVPLLGNGPVFYKLGELTHYVCDKYWWTNALFINNLYPWH